MIQINQLDELYQFSKALASPIRIQIISLLSQTESLSMNELADKLSITSGALTPHIKYLENAHIINIQNVNGKHGVQKKCSLYESKYLISFVNESSSNLFETELPIGGYSSYEVSSPCGLSSPTSLIGRADDARYFDDPARFSADIIWFKQGFLEYRIPNYLQEGQRLTELKITQELNSEVLQNDSSSASDIYFSLNGLPLGFWTTTEVRDTQGIHTPEWWSKNHFMPCGSLKELLITEDGTFLNGSPFSEVTLPQLSIYRNSSILYRISIPAQAANQNGLTLYGKNFGSYRQGITVSMKFGNLENR